MAMQNLKLRIINIKQPNILSWFYLFTIFSTAILLVGQQRPAFAAAGSGGIIEGSIDYPANSDASLPDSHYAPGIPGVKVYAKNIATLAKSPMVTTDKKGAFVIPNQPTGSYYLCWQGGPTGITAGCDTREPFEVINQVSTRYIPNNNNSNDYNGPAPDSAQAVLGGFVTFPGAAPPFANNAACVYTDPFFGINMTAKIELINPVGRVVATSWANTDGRYIIGVKNIESGVYQLKTSCAGNSTQVAANLGAIGSYLQQNVTLPANKVPTITSMTASLQAQAVSGVPLGSTVKVTVNAADADTGNVLHYRWLATAGRVIADDKATVSWTLPTTGKGLHFLYVDVDDRKGGHKSQRVAISTDGGVVAATSPALALPKPSDNFLESDRFLTYRGMDTRKSACQYYKAIRAVMACDGNGNPVGSTLTFNQWLSRNAIGGPNGPAKPGEIIAIFRNVADLDLVRNHHARKVNPNRIAYYVCNHGLPPGVTLPTGNLVACVAMEYSIINGVNNNKPFVQFYTFGPTGRLYLSVNLDGRGEKFIPGNCVVCHGGDGYFHHFPENGVNPARDANIGAYMLPFDLDNYEFSTHPKFTRNAQENAVRNLNLLIKQTSPTPVARQLINGWYPGGIGKQNSNYVPPGWNENLDTSLPAKSRGDTFNASELYLKTVKHSCRLCHVAMGTKLGLDFNRYQQLVQKDSSGNPVLDPTTNEPIPVDDPSTPPDDRVGDFVDGHAGIFGSFNQIGQSNALHTADSVCSEFGDGLPTWNIFDNTNEPGKTMPNALQTFNRFWQNPEQLDLLALFLEKAGESSDGCNAATRPIWAVP